MARAKKDKGFLLLLLILLVLLSFYYVFPSLFLQDSLESGASSSEENNEPNPEEEIYKNLISEIMSDPNEYMNEEYIKTLSMEEKNIIKDELDEEIGIKCKEGEFNGVCKKSFMAFSLRIFRLMNRNFSDLESYEKIKACYTDLKEDASDSGFSAGNLHDFSLVFLNYMCSSDFPEMDCEEEKDFWSEKIINVKNKKTWDDTHSQIYYFWNCMNFKNLTSLAAETGLNRADLESSICSPLPDLQEINKEDLCLLNDYMVTKIFCETSIPEDEISFMESFISQVSDTNYQKNCAKMLESLMKSNL